MNQEIQTREDLNMKALFSVLRMSRALKRCPPDQGERPFPPAVGRMLHCVQMNPGVSSRELCELLDLRPSSLSEMLTRGEEEGLLIRAADEEDRRGQHIRLSERGETLLAGMAEAQRNDAVRKTACFSEEEKEKLAELCDRLSEHLEKLSLDVPRPEHGPRHHGSGPRDRRPGRPPEGHGRPEREEDEAERRDGRPQLPPGARIRC